MGASLQIFQATDVLVGRISYGEEPTEDVQRCGGLSPIEAGEGGHSGAFVYGAPHGQESGGEDFFPVGSMLETEDTQHGVQVTVGPFHRIGLWIVRGREGQPDICALQGFPHKSRSEVRGVVSMDLQRVTESGEEKLQLPDYGLAGDGGQRDGLKPLTENIFQR